ncbi:MAG: hypothetical protein AAB380_00875, partial [Verrucomicrobiota bacterium]
MSNLLQEIEAQISGVKTSVARQNVGTVREISDGVAKIEGLTDAMLNEMLDFGNGVVGLALNLEETEVGARPDEQPEVPRHAVDEVRFRGDREAPSVDVADHCGETRAPAQPITERRPFERSCAADTRTQVDDPRRIAA